MRGSRRVHPLRFVAAFALRASAEVEARLVILQAEMHGFGGFCPDMNAQAPFSFFGRDECGRGVSRPGEAVG
jgi:hypothetical protein